MLTSGLLLPDHSETSISSSVIAGCVLIRLRWSRTLLFVSSVTELT